MERRAHVPAAVSETAAAAVAAYVRGEISAEIAVMRLVLALGSAAAVGEHLAAAGQSRLLRVLETKRLSRVGGSSDLEVDVRVLASTNRSPAQAFEEGRLREDIYYRLAVVTVQLPPLRDRADDVLVLAEFFLSELNLHHGTRKRLSDDLRARFVRHRWPGNVRELRNAVERAFILCDGELSLSEQDMPTLRAGQHGEGASSDLIQLPIGATLEEIERTFILATLKHFEGDKRRAADVLGCSLKTLYNKLHAYQRERHAGMN